MQRHHEDYASELYSLCQVSYEKPEVVTASDRVANAEVGKSLRVNAMGYDTMQESLSALMFIMRL
jgi:hypothetical protein